MDIAQEKIDLIGKLIKNDRKYANNEDLFDDFLNESCKRSLAVIDSIDSQATLEAYLRRIVTTSIINVLKDTGRLRRTSGTYKPVQQISLDEPSIPTKDYSKISIDYTDIELDDTPEEILIQKEILEFVADTILAIDKEEPEKEYLKIYSLRYDKGMIQKEIAEEVGISQSEVSKRLFSLMEKVRNVIE